MFVAAGILPVADVLAAAAVPLTECASPDVMVVAGWLVAFDDADAFSTTRAGWRLRSGELAVNVSEGTVTAEGLRSDSWAVTPSGYSLPSTVYDSSAPFSPWAFLSDTLSTTIIPSSTSRFPPEMFPDCLLSIMMLPSSGLSSTGAMDGFS